MKTIVSGATGFVGKALVERLRAEGDVIALARTPAAARLVLPANCSVEPWDGEEPIDQEVFWNADAVVHLCGEPVAGGRWTTERKRAIFESRVRSTRRLVESMSKLPRGERPRVLVCASAIGYYGNRGDVELDEDSSSGSGFLADVCRAWETAALSAVELGIRTVTLRLGVVLGPDGGALARMLPIFRLGLGGRLGSGNQWMSWIDRVDVVRLIAHAITNPQVEGALNAVAPEPVRNRDFTTALGRALSRPTLIPAPEFVLRLAMGEMASILFDSQRVLPKKALGLGFQFERPDLEQALAALVAPSASARPASTPAPAV